MYQNLYILIDKGHRIHADSAKLTNWWILWLLLSMKTLMHALSLCCPVGSILDSIQSPLGILCPRSVKKFSFSNYDRIEIAEPNL